MRQSRKGAAERNQEELVLSLALEWRATVVEIAGGIGDGRHGRVVDRFQRLGQALDKLRVLRLRGAAKVRARRETAREFLAPGEWME